MRDFRVPRLWKVEVLRSGEGVISGSVGESVELKRGNEMDYMLDTFLEVIKLTLTITLAGVCLRAGWELYAWLKTANDNLCDKHIPRAFRACRRVCARIWRRIEHWYLSRKSFVIPKGTRVKPDNDEIFILETVEFIPGVSMAEAVANCKAFAEASKLDASPSQRIEAMKNLHSKGPWTVDDMKRIAREQVAAFAQVPIEERPAEMREAEFCWHPTYSEDAFIAAFDDLGTIKVMWTDGEIASGYLQFDLGRGEAVIAIEDEDQEKFDMHGCFTLDGEEV